MTEKTKIFCLINTRYSHENMIVASVYEKDGELCGLASHLSSSEDWAKHDIGIGSDWKHDHYDSVLGKDNWELEWVDDPKTHPVISKHIKKPEAEHA